MISATSVNRLEPSIDSAFLFAFYPPLSSTIDILTPHLKIGNLDQEKKVACLVKKVRIDLLQLINPTQMP